MVALEVFIEYQVRWFTDHTFILKTPINKYVGKLNKNAYLSFVDFKKPFDRGSYLQNVRKRKSLNVSKYWKLRQCGCKAMDSSSATLFNIFIDDIASCSERSTIKSLTICCPFGFNFGVSFRASKLCKSFRILLYSVES